MGARIHATPDVSEKSIMSFPLAKLDRTASFLGVSGVRDRSAVMHDFLRASRGKFTEIRTSKGPCQEP